MCKKNLMGREDLNVPWSDAAVAWVPQELLCRSALETQKLDLMTEISTLKLKLGAMEKDRLDFDEQFRDGEV